MITGIAHTPERETFMHYVPVSYYAVRPVFYTQKGMDLAQEIEQALQRKG